MKGGTNAQKEAIDETIKLAKQIAKLSFSPTYSNTSQMEDLFTQIQDLWANSGQNVLDMSNNVIDDEKRQLEEELAELEKEFKDEAEGIKRKRKSTTKGTTKRTTKRTTKGTTKRSTKKRKQKGGGQIEDLKKAANNLDIALQNINNYSGDINTKKDIERNLLFSKLLVLRKIKELESRPPPPPSRNSSSRRSPSRRSAPRQSKSLFSCLPGMSCSNAKGIRKKRRRRRRTRRKR